MKTPDFESIKQVNALGHEYWSARDLAPLLGYHTQWRNFEGCIRDALIAAAEGGLDLDENFAAVSKVSGQRGPAQKDYFLSKRACYLVAQNADPRKSEVAAAMNYFAFAAEVVDDLTKLRVEQEKRLQLRLKVAQANTTLAETALNSGVQSKNMPIFQDAGYMGQYHMTENQLAAFWNVPPGTRILDVMGVEQLAANLFRITQTDAKLERDNVEDEDVAIATHHEIGALVRETIERIYNIKPEDLPRGADIRKLVEAERRKEKKRLKSKPSDDQETLF